MATKTNDCSSQVVPLGENVAVDPSQSAPLDHQASRSRNQVFKSGPLFISSKGIGWTSWKKRWFILTRTSLVFFRSDPSSAHLKGNEMNLTLGGIDLNNSASVEVKVDKKLLTVFFPDGRDGRAFTLKAETLEDLHEWKTALESALAQAPNATHVVGQNGILKNEQADVANGSTDQQKDRPPAKSIVIGRPILLALEDIDGSPSFLEKALRFIEDHGVRVEGILRQAADVEEVHHRVHEYEQGKTEFSPDEDAHVIADCIKYILRELPSSPVPASCCNALLEAFRSDRNNRLNAMRTAILETFPEPNRRLLQRILMMMQKVAYHKAENRMSISAVAACMSPLLLRPLLAGDCQLENTHMDVAGDGSFQLLQAAAAANHAQAIIITLLEEYDNFFGEGSMSAELFSNSDESGSGTEEASDDDELYDDEEEEDDEDEGEDYDVEGGSDEHDVETDDDYEHSVAEVSSDGGNHDESDSYDDKQSERSHEREDNHLANQRSLSASPRTPTAHHDNMQCTVDTIKLKKDQSSAEVGDSSKAHRNIPAERSSMNDSVLKPPTLGSENSATNFLGSSQTRNHRWGRTSAQKNLSMESIDFSLEEEDEIERLEGEKIELQNRIAKETSGNEKLQASLERRKKALHERRLALEKDVARLQEQLQNERDQRANLESGGNFSQIPVSEDFDEQTKVEIEEIALAEENFNSLKQRLDEIGAEINRQSKQNTALMKDRCIILEETSSQATMLLHNKDNTAKDASHHVESSSENEVGEGISQSMCKLDGADQKNITSINKIQTMPSETSRGGGSRFGWLSSSSLSLDVPVPKHSFSTSRKSSKVEGGNSTASALTKLTTRLNFLKERRNQIASELQHIDKGRGSAAPAIVSAGKGKGSESSHTSHNIEKYHGSESSFDQNQEDFPHLSSHNAVMGMSTGANNEDNNRKGDKDSNKKGNHKDANKKGFSLKPNSSSSQIGDQGLKLENQSNQHLDRVKLDEPSSKSSDKGRQQDGQHSHTSRTLSR